MMWGKYRFRVDQNTPASQWFLWNVLAFFVRCWWRSSRGTVPSGAPWYRSSCLERQGLVQCVGGGLTKTGQRPSNVRFWIPLGLQSQATLWQTCQEVSTTSDRGRLGARVEENKKCDFKVQTVNLSFLKFRHGRGKFVSLPSLGLMWI